MRAQNCSQNIVIQNLPTRLKINVPVSQEVMLWDSFLSHQLATWRKSNAYNTTHKKKRENSERKNYATSRVRSIVRRMIIALRWCKQKYLHLPIQPFNKRRRKKSLASFTAVSFVERYPVWWVTSIDWPIPSNRWLSGLNSKHFAQLKSQKISR